VTKKIRNPYEPQKTPKRTLTGCRHKWIMKDKKGSPYDLSNIIIVKDTCDE